ncbi:class I SAM-dependent methyltransferase [Cohnella abietis]|uniref:class I SAM-dependent methyltransferase n=1 Tax=Cohnella abietis TaxID=2507935 RepID=UPI00102E51F9|nr:SAM-dependent methyltransferase [Cohnella abietis]
MKADLTESPLTAIIRNKILASLETGRLDDGRDLPAIPFHQYMTLCLYHPEFGYYRAGFSRVGREGDFYTSSYVGEMMGEQLGEELVRLAGYYFPNDERIAVFEWGGGTGRLARQMMDVWYLASDRDGKMQDQEKGFTLALVEGNPEHRRLAIEELDEYIQTGKARVVTTEEAEDLLQCEQPAIIVANELLDAFPTHRLVRRGELILEWGVTWEEGKGLVSCLLEPISAQLNNWIQEEGHLLSNNQTVEVNLDAMNWINNLTGRLDRAMMVLIDYGDETEELISPHRMEGTLLCYYKHRAHSDPYLVPGEQDLTSHVNFSHIRQTAQKSGWKEIEYVNQKNFLVKSGILDKLSSHTISDPFHPIARRNRAIRQLLLSDGMSELFKVQILIKQ